MGWCQLTLCDCVPGEDDEEYAISNDPAAIEARAPPPFEDFDLVLGRSDHVDKVRLVFLLCFTVASHFDDEAAFVGVPSRPVVCCRLPLCCTYVFALNAFGSLTQ
jgi:hypothetical protein